MYLLKYSDDGEFTLATFDGDCIPEYAIFSHRWLIDTEEPTFEHLTDSTGKGKLGYRKLRFCGEQARQDGLQYFWVDTCCIHKAKYAELSQAINFMFRWYRNATRCYVYLSDVSSQGMASAFKSLEKEIEKLNKCVQDLRLTDPRDDKKRIKDIKGGLLKDSYRWILENSDYQQWDRAQKSRLLWIKGDPGKGKTMLLCGINNQLGKPEAEIDLLSYFFCQATDSRINNAAAVLRGLIHMLIDQQPLLVAHVREKYDRAGKALFEDANAWVTLSEIFISILQDPGLNGACLIIDALNECVADLPKQMGHV